MSPGTGETSLSVVFGAEWRPLHAPEPGHEIASAAQVCRGGGGTHFALVECQGEGQVGWIRGRFGSGTRLAGQLLASVVGAKEVCFLDAIDTGTPNPFRAATLLFVGAQSLERRVAVAVLNGAPVFEVTGGQEEVLRRAQEFTDKLHSGGLLLVQREIEAECEGLRRAVPAGYRVVESLPLDVDWAVRTGELRPAGLSRRSLALAGAAAVLAGTPAVYLVNRQLERRRLAQQGAAAARGSAQEGVAAFERLQRDAFAQAPLVRADAAARMVFEFARHVLDSRAGFRVARLSVTPKDTIAHYVRADRRRTFSDFVAEADEGTPAFDVARLDEANAVYPPLAWDRLPVVDPARPGDAANVVLDLGTLAQKVEAVGVKLSLTPPQAALNPEQLARIDAASLLRVGRKSGAWSATGPVDLFVGVCEAMPAQACTLAEAEFHLAASESGEFVDTFRAKGRYFVGWS